MTEENTPNTLPSQYHHPFCGCNPFYTNPKCWDKFTKDKPAYDKYLAEKK